MKVITIDEYDYDKVIDFLKNIEGIKIDNEVINNASILVDDNEDIIGLISFEVFNNYGLIRYFIFKKIIDEISLEALFKNLLKKAKNRKVAKLFSFVHNEVTSPIFDFLGFTQIDKGSVYLEEKKFESIYNQNAFVYGYDIK